MFNKLACEQIKQVPGLDNLDPQEVSAELSKLHARIASARLALRKENIDGFVEDISAEADRINRLANTYEAMVALEIPGVNIKAASFVSGMSKQLIFQLQNLVDNKPKSTKLDKNCVGAEISAALLFLIAERQADALEIGLKISSKKQKIPVLVTLLNALRDFCVGNIIDVASIDVDGCIPEESEFEDNEDYISCLLYHNILKGLIELSNELVGYKSKQSSNEIFKKVISLSAETYVHKDIGKAISLYAGPHYLATLLKVVTNIILKSAMIRTPTPIGANEETWWEWLSKESDSRTFLWENHQRAVKTGYLNIGTSSILTCPTGSGKTTLAVLKIAAVRSANKKIIYLAPTHALVAQVEADLKKRLSDIANISGVQDDFIEEFDGKLPELAVMTPEACYSHLAFNPEIFAEVGLLIFDECHLLDADKKLDSNGMPTVNRRSIDAMLCVLSFVRYCPSADLLLMSAMVSNGEEIASWIEKITQRDCISFADSWKPTRQARGVVFYDQEEYTTLKTAIVKQRSKIKKEKGADAKPNKSVEKLALLEPLVYFNLEAGWNQEDTKEHVSSLLPEKIQLSVNKYWGLTSNRNHIASKIAEAGVKAGLKTLIFCENIDWTSSVSAPINASNSGLKIEDLNEDQVALRSSALSEIGSLDAMYDVLNCKAAVHHGELLPSERQLVESLFAETDSPIKILAATSTLAQGLNLPADLVILAGTDRMDEDNDRRTNLKAHEILNSIGRAGRAGFSATGLSIIIPGEILTYDPKNGKINKPEILKSVFSEQDRCLTIDDPLAAILDKIETHGLQGDDSGYLIKRLAVSLHPGADEHDQFDNLFKRSLGYYRIQKKSEHEALVWLQARRNKIEKLVEKEWEEDTLSWLEVISARTGVSIELLRSFQDLISDNKSAYGLASEWIKIILDYIEEYPEDLIGLLRPWTLEKIFGRAYTNQATLNDKATFSINAIKELLPMWLNGSNLIEIENKIVEIIQKNEGKQKQATKAEKKVKRARRFMLRLIPDIAFIAGCFKQVVHTTEGIEPNTLFFLDLLPNLLRNGYEKPSQMVYGNLTGSLSRVDTHISCKSFEIKDSVITSWGHLYTTVQGVIDLDL